VHIRECHWGKATEALETALEHAIDSRDDAAIAKVASWLVTPLFYGPMPASDVVRRYRELLTRHGTDRYIDAFTSYHLSGALAMIGQFDAARTAGEHGLAALEDLGLWLAQAISRVYIAQAEQLAGDLDAAARHLRRGYEMLQTAGDASTARNIGYELAHLLCIQQRYDDAESVASVERATLQEGDVMTRIVGYATEARLAAVRGEQGEATRLAEQAVGLASKTDALNFHAGALLCRSDILAASGREAEASEARGRAVALYERKGNVAAASQVRAAALSITDSSRSRRSAGAR
jgi:tetratricopeptide (TPR) repeat protein